MAHDSPGADVSHRGLPRKVVVFPEIAREWSDGTQPDNQPLKEGSVEFVHSTGAAFLARGELDPQGNFTLSTISGKKVLPGAAEGDYIVTISRPMGADQILHSVRMPTMYKVEAKANYFEIVLDRIP